MQMVGGTQPFFDPYGWTPEKSFEEALAAMGWSSTVAYGEDETDALDKLREALRDGPVWVGPVEMGYLSHQPGKTGPLGADHYVVVVDLDGEHVLLHDPQGYPYARLPVGRFLKAWRAETLDYGSAFTMRSRFRQTAVKSEDEILHAALPNAAKWLGMTEADDAPPGTLGNSEAAIRLAENLEDGPGDDLRDHLIHFAIRVGARRALDAASCLNKIGYSRAAAILDRQARSIGSMQYFLVVGDNREAAAYLRELAPTYEALSRELKIYC